MFSSKPYTPLWSGFKKESVELTFVYPQRGSDKTQAKINDAMPHTCTAGHSAVRTHHMPYEYKKRVLFAILLLV